MTLPHAAMFAKLAAGVQDCAIGFIGDSTVAGYGDLTSPGGGYPKFLGEDIASYYDYNIYYSGWNTAGAGWPAPTLYQAAPIRGSAAPKLTIWNGAVSGTALSNQEAYLSTDLITGLDHASNPASVILSDFIMIGTGFNDVPLSSDVATFQPAYAAYIPHLQSAVPGIPLIVTDENPLSAASYYDDVFLSIATWLTGETSLPTSQPLLVSNTVPGVTFMDSRQAYDGVAHASDYFSFGVHPNAAGYMAEATWMFNTFQSSLGTPPTITTPTLGDMAMGAAFAQTLTASGPTPITWTLATGSVLPANLTLDPSGVLSGVPSAGGPYDFTVQATNQYNTVSQRYTGTISSKPPFNPTGVVKRQIKLNGQWYPRRRHIYSGGVWRPTISRH